MLTLQVVASLPSNVNLPPKALCKPYTASLWQPSVMKPVATTRNALHQLGSSCCWRVVLYMVLGSASLCPSSIVPLLLQEQHATQAHLPVPPTIKAASVLLSLQLPCTPLSLLQRKPPSRSHRYPLEVCLVQISHRLQSLDWTSQAWSRAEQASVWVPTNTWIFYWWFRWFPDTESWPGVLMSSPR